MERKLDLAVLFLLIWVAPPAVYAFAMFDVQALDPRAWEPMWRGVYMAFTLVLVLGFFDATNY
jgi:hypothetical protein